MKLDNDLIRELLLYIEENGDYEKGLYDIDINGYTQDEIKYHLIILNESQYIKSNKIKTIGMLEESIIPIRLTEKGHRYIENIRDNKVWNYIKRQLKLKRLNLSLDMLLKFSTEYIKSRF